MAMANDDLQALRKKRNWMELTVDEFINLTKMVDRSRIVSVGDVFKINDDIPITGTTELIMKVSFVSDTGKDEQHYSFEMCYIK